MEGLCHKHRFEDYTNQCLNWIAEWSSIDAEYIQQQTISLNWVKPPPERSQVPRYKSLRAQAKQMLRERLNAPPLNENEESEFWYWMLLIIAALEILPLGRSRRQNSSYMGDVFNPVIGAHRPESPPALTNLILA